MPLGQKSILLFITKHFWLLLLLWSLLMVGVGTAIECWVLQIPPADSPGSELRLEGGNFTNPLLECDLGSDYISSQKNDFTPDLQSFVDTVSKRLGVSEMAVYFRDLNNGPVIGINQNMPFAPASLLKVPIMMTYFSRAESDANLLSEKILTKQTAHLLPGTQEVNPQEHIVLGKTYSIEELIEYMIKYSDNQAMAILYDHMPLKEQADLYSLLGVNPSILTDASAQLSVRQYSIFFRVLFNASFLSRAHSEQALKLLSENNFSAGLRAGVPEAVPIAHKFGERQFGDSLQQFHDCGIVYYPKSPYLLCIMTRGKDAGSLVQAIAETSRFIYGKIDKQ